MSTRPSASSSVTASEASGISFFSSISSKIRAAQASAFWSSVMTPDISLNGLVYWFAYDKKHESCPTVIPPVSALMAPKIPTPAYTRLLTKRVHGFVRLEKNVALSEHFCNLSFISSNCSSASSSWLKACTTFSFPTISSMSDVCSPLVLVCSWNME